MAPWGSRAARTRSAMARSARGSPQTRRRSFHSVGHRDRIRLPPSRTARLAERLDLPGGLVQGPLAQGMGADDPVAGVGLDRPSARIEPVDEAGDRRGPEVGHEADRPVPAAWNPLSASQSGTVCSPSTTMRSVRPISLLNRSICQRTESALSSKPMASTGVTRRTVPAPGRRPRAAGALSRSRAIGRVPDVLSRSSRSAAAMGPVSGTQAIAEASGNRPDLERELRDDAERPHRAGQELGEVVAGDVLDDPPAPLDDHAVGRDEADADDLVAGPARAEPPRAGRVGRVDPAQRRPVGMRARRPARR